MYKHYELTNNFFDILFKTSHYAILILLEKNNDIKIINANPAALKLFKYTNEEITNLALSDIIISDDFETFIHSTDECIDGEEFDIVDNEYEILSTNVTFSTVTVNNEIFKLVNFYDLTKERKCSYELTKSNKRYDALVEEQVEFIYRFDRDGIITFVNNAYCNFFGKKCSDVLGCYYYDLLPDMSKDLIKNSIGSLSQSKLFNHYDNKIIFRDGSIKWIHWSDRIIFHNNNPNDYEYQSIGFDITELKRLEYKLVKQNITYKGILDSLLDGFYRIDKNCNVTCVSASTVSILGYQNRSEILNRPISDFFLNSKELRQILQRMKNAGGKLSDQETKIFTRSGQIIDVSFNGQFIFNKNKKIIGIQGMFRDITEMKKKVDEIIKLYQVVESSNNVIMIIDSDGKIEYVNKSVRNFMNIPDYIKLNDIIIGKKLKSFITFDSPLKFSTVCKIIEEKNKWFGSAYCYNIYQEYKKIPIDIMFSKFIDQYNKFYVIASFHDISEQIRLKRKIEEQSKMYEELYGSMSILVDKMNKFNNLKLNNIHTLEEAFSKSINSIITLDGELTDASV